LEILKTAIAKGAKMKLKCVTPLTLSKHPPVKSLAVNALQQISVTAKGSVKQEAILALASTQTRTESPDRRKRGKHIIWYG
jgi:hypothetical protein